MCSFKTYLNVEPAKSKVCSLKYLLELIFLVVCYCSGSLQLGNLCLEFSACICRDYVQGIGNRSINPLHLCPNHSAFSMKAVCFTLT